MGDLPPDNLSTGLQSLSISTSAKSARAPQQKKKEPPVVADSWEDELDSSGPEAESEPEAEESAPPSPPPPTPKTPLAASERTPPPSPPARLSARSPAPNKRPEKTDAVARRMISAALGVRVKSTADQRAYDKALRKRREEEKERRRKEIEQEEAAKRSAWED